QLQHASSITAFAAPTINSYKRYRPGTWAPIRAAWGIDNRAAMARLLIAGDNTRIENRIGASDANPYLLGAAQLAAGLEGMSTLLDPGTPSSGNAAEDPQYATIPMNLMDAMRALEADTVLTRAMGAEFCELYVDVQRHVWQRYQEHVTDWEIREYKAL